MRLVLVDLDGTLLASGSEARFIGHLIASRRIGARALLNSLGFALRYAPRFGLHVWKKNKAYLAGLSQDEVERLARTFALDRLCPLIRTPMRERIASHRVAGDHVLLLTGSPEFLARPLAEAVGADGWIATVCTQAGGVFLDAPPHRHPFGGEKLILARQAAHRLGLSLADCLAYADSGDDIVLLAAVGGAVAVAPDRRLLRHARAAGWEIVARRRARPSRSSFTGIGPRA